MGTKMTLSARAELTNESGDATALQCARRTLHTSRRLLSCTHQFLEVAYFLRTRRLKAVRQSLQMMLEDVVDDIKAVEKAKQYCRIRGV